MNTRSFGTVPLIAAAIMVLAAGCSTAGSNAASTSAAYKPEEPDITVAAIPAVDLVGLYLAQEDGLFARQGLHVTIEKIPSSQAIIADQLKGKVDITAGSYVAYISAQAAGARFRILAEASILGPGTRALVTTAGSPITTIAGLAGRKIGVNGINSIGTLLVSALLAEHGISPEKVDFVTDQEGFPSMPGQLRDGAWDAAFLAEPYITVAGEEFGEQVLVDLDEGATFELPHRRVHRHPGLGAEVPQDGGRVRAGHRRGTDDRQQRRCCRPGRHGTVRQTAAPGDRGHGAVRLSDRPSERYAHPARRPGHAPVRHTRQAIRH